MKINSLNEKILTADTKGQFGNYYTYVEKKKDVEVNNKHVHEQKELAQQQMQDETKKQMAQDLLKAKNKKDLNAQIQEKQNMMDKDDTQTKQDLIRNNKVFKEGEEQKLALAKEKQRKQNYLKNELQSLIESKH